MGESDESAEEWNYTVPASTRLSTQTSERLDEYQEQEDIGKSEALRRTIRTGLDHELEHEAESEEDEPDQPPEDVLLALGVILGLAVAGGYLSGGGNPDQTVTYLTVALLGAGLLLRYRKHD